MVFLKELSQATREFVDITHLALPYNKYAPSISAQSRTRSLVARGIALKFCAPERAPRFRHDPSVSARVPVPEATVNKNNGTTRRKHEIGPTG